MKALRLLFWVKDFRRLQRSVCSFIWVMFLTPLNVGFKAVFLFKGKDIQTVWE